MITCLIDLKLSDYTLIIPSVSVGNVGQLTAEILLASIKFTKLGYIWHRNILPVTVKSETSEDIHTACELFVSQDLKLVLLQIRSTFGPFVSISKTFKELCSSVKCVVILTGAFAYERKNIQQHLCYVESPKFNEIQGLTIPAQWSHLEHYSIERSVKIPGSGIADHLFNQCVQDGTPALMLIEYVSEGDNRTDAEVLANYLDELLHLKERSGSENQKWKPPAVWDLVFGNRCPTGLF